MYKTKRRGERTHPWGELKEDRRLPETDMPLNVSFSISPGGKTQLLHHLLPSKSCYNTCSIKDWYLLAHV